MLKLQKIIAFAINFVMLPVVVMYLSNFITHAILIPLGICTEYDGNGFGSSVICSIFPSISYFGGMIFMFSGLIFIFFIIIAMLLPLYYIFVYINYRNVRDFFRHTLWTIPYLLFLLYVGFSILFINYAVSNYEVSGKSTVVSVSILPGSYDIGSKKDCKFSAGFSDVFMPCDTHSVTISLESETQSKCYLEKGEEVIQRDISSQSNFTINNLTLGNYSLTCDHYDGVSSQLISFKKFTDVKVDVSATGSLYEGGVLLLLDWKSNNADTCRIEGRGIREEVATTGSVTIDASSIGGYYYLACVTNDGSGRDAKEVHIKTDGETEIKPF
jgi:hypothetical protein